MAGKSKASSKARAALNGATVKPASAPTPSQSITRTTDNKGRVGLGRQFANRTVLVRPVSDTEFVIKLSRDIPESEAWLYENAEAISRVRAGLSQARAGKLKPGPDLEGDAKFAAELEG